MESFLFFILNSIFKFIIYILSEKYRIAAVVVVISIILLGILWELFEYMIVKVDVLYNLTKQYWFVPEKYWNESIYNKIIDMIFNILGYSLGCYIFYYSNNKK